MASEQSKRGSAAASEGRSVSAATASTASKKLVTLTDRGNRDVIGVELAAPDGEAAEDGEKFILAKWAAQPVVDLPASFHRTEGWVAMGKAIKVFFE